ncbi:MRG-domain-containing protein [Tricladium varicosporioides]|nr:MRG-domain-containing protein [Hymenoscyphus varicosporioides]
MEHSRSQSGSSLSSIPESDVSEATIKDELTDISNKHSFSDKDAGPASPSLERRLCSNSDGLEQGLPQANFSARRSRRGIVDVAAWSDPSSPEWDVIRVLQSDACLAEDYLTKKPTSNHTYLTGLGAFKDRSKYEKMRKPKVASGPTLTTHPKLQSHINNGTDTTIIRHYYAGIPADRCLPTAGIIFGESGPVDVVTKRSSLRTFINGKASPSTVHGITTTSLPENTPPGSLTGKAAHKIFSGKASRMMNNIENPNLTQHLQEETFHQRPSIKLIIPDHIKALLVDDWENVTKNQQLVPLPSAHPVNSILDDYYNYEMPRRIAGSAQADILEEVIAGLKDYFEKCLGRILLYRFERNQYTEVREAWMSNRGDMSGKGAGDTYGAEHLCRLLVSLPELIAQTNMDSQSVNRLREELSKMANWLGRNAEHYFVKEYETPSQQYVEKARGV